jgi:hypothetical protein
MNILKDVIPECDNSKLPAIELPAIEGATNLLADPTVEMPPEIIEGVCRVTLRQTALDRWTTVTIRVTKG